MQTNNMTQGTPAKLLTAFALPILAGSLVQQAYTLVDSFVLGKFVNTEALTAVSCTSWIYWLIINIFTGFTQGFSIIISQQYGAGENKKMKKSIAMSSVLSILLTVIITTAALLCIKKLLVLLRTPDNVISMSALYLYIVTSGVFITMLYNLLSSFLRAIGDTTTSFIALIISSVFNIVLDAIFVVKLNLGVAGVAAATLISQIISCIICFAKIKRLEIFHLNSEDWRFHLQTSWKLFKVGIPLATQNIVISIGGLIMQGIINSYGYVFTTAVSLTGKLINLIQQTGVSFSVALGTYVAQNLGANKTQRLKQGVNVCLKMNILFAVTSGLLFILIGKPVLRLFLNSKGQAASLNPKIIHTAYYYLVIQCIFLFVVYMLYTYRAALLGSGQTFIPMVSGIAELLIRLAAASLLPILIGKQGVLFADVIAWFGAGGLLMFTYYSKTLSKIKL
ncbi:MATE family efflux transporter [[Clostridium] polysaccharolyticum]|uniref:Probable multidrug resistance protein NorM n=1 Tax=[Clostridium] polysaccharolyticum TaxID=29364 RepID=A0A1I0BLR5_9FIRM|nr:MATE family efflux transporter [[Clostridium] polysaccharolyticum]SET07937.1 putative efflux protein, MATE family [[Clostridium] polysaccharolyticum]